jgi:hypothetical protein
MRVVATIASTINLVLADVSTLPLLPVATIALVHTVDAAIAVSTVAHVPIAVAGVFAPWCAVTSAIVGALWHAIAIVATSFVMGCPSIDTGLSAVVTAATMEISIEASRGRRAIFLNVSDTPWWPETKVLEGDDNLKSCQRNIRYGPTHQVKRYVSRKSLFTLLGLPSFAAACFPWA